jgi:hypothetical protein
MIKLVELHFEKELISAQIHFSGELPATFDKQGELSAYKLRFLG